MVSARFNDVFVWKHTSKPLWLILGRQSSNENARLHASLAVDNPASQRAVELIEQPDGLILARVRSSPEPIGFEWRWG